MFVVLLQKKKTKKEDGDESFLYICETASMRIPYYALDIFQFQKCPVFKEKNKRNNLELGSPVVALRDTSQNNQKFKFLKINFLQSQQSNRLCYQSKQNYCCYVVVTGWKSLLDKHFSVKKALFKAYFYGLSLSRRRFSFKLFA